MNPFFRKPMTRRKVVLLAGTALAMLFAVWLVWGFNGGSSDVAKYRRLHELRLTYGRLFSLRQRLPPRVSKFIHLSDFMYREKLKYDLLRIELLTSGYLTNVTFALSNFSNAEPRITAAVLKNFDNVRSLDPRVVLYFQGQSPTTPKLVTFTCRAQDVLLFGQIISGDSNAPAKPIDEPKPDFDADIPVLYEGIPGGELRR